MNVAQIVESASVSGGFGAKCHAAAAAEGARAAVVEPHERLDQSVLRARRQLHPELHLPREPLDAAKQLVRGVEAQLVASLAFGERHRVGESDLAGVGREGGLQHERAREIAPLRRVGARGPDRPVAGIRVE